MPGQGETTSRNKIDVFAEKAKSVAISGDDLLFRNGTFDHFG